MYSTECDLTGTSKLIFVDLLLNNSHSLMLLLCFFSSRWAVGPNGIQIVKRMSYHAEQKTNTGTDSWWWCCSVQPDRWKKWRLVSHFEMHFRDLAPSAVNVTCLKNWITSKNHSGVNIRPSWPRSDSRAAVGDVKAPPATLGTLWEPFGNPLGTLWGPFGNPLGTLWGNSFDHSSHSSLQANYFLLKPLN